jgi:hypothetical protein
VYKQVLRNAKLQFVNRGQKTGGEFSQANIVFLKVFHVEERREKEGAITVL